MMTQPLLNTGTLIGKPEIDKETIVLEDEETEGLWLVIAHNDDVTTMEFVVRVLVTIFKKPLVFAESIMWQIHHEGISVVDSLPKAEAESRARRATLAARLEGFPFKLTVEPADK